MPGNRWSACFHGGAFFEAIGVEFNDLNRRTTIINADVLDAWFPPSPKVMSALQEHLPWLVRTSPPAACDGLLTTISRVRNIPAECLLPGGGSSDLIFRAFCHWLSRDSKVLILDPTYGEYTHLLEKVIGCEVERLFLRKEDAYRVDLDELERKLKRGYELVVLVNPNSPTGQHVPREELRPLLANTAANTRVWIDETYIEYTGTDKSLESFAAGSENIVVCKSMSKVYALSGLRAAYLCGPQVIIDELRAMTPPWVISLPGQVAAVVALNDPEYYQGRYFETHRLRNELFNKLSEWNGWEVVPGVANFLLCHMPTNGPNAATIIIECRRHGLFLRDASTMGARMGQQALRISVKDTETSGRMLGILADVTKRQCGTSPRLTQPCDFTTKTSDWQPAI